MIRTLICALLALVMAVGLAEAAKSKTRKKTKATLGKFVSFKDGILTIHTRKAGDKQFKIADGTSVRVYKDGEKKAAKLAAPAAFKDVAPDASISVRVDEAGKVSRVVVNRPLRTKKPKP
jgi:hypothetical protein